MNAFKPYTKFTIYSGVITPFLNSCPLYALTKRMEELYPGWGFDDVVSIYTKEGDISYWIQNDEMVIPRYKALLDNKKILEGAYKVWLVKEKVFYTFVAKLGKKCALEDFDDFVKIYVDEYAAALLTEYFYLGSEYAYKQAVTSYPKLKPLIDECVRPLIRTFTMEDELALLQIALVDDQSERKILLEHHQKKFFWICNNYKYTNELPVSYFEDEVRVLREKGKDELRNRMQKIENYEQHQEKLLLELKKQVDQRTYDDVYWISKLAHWQDRRKRANLVADHWGHVFLAKASLQLNIPFKELQFALFNEVQQLLAGKKLDLPLKERMTGCAHVCTRGGEHYIITGPVFHDLKKRFLDTKVHHQYDIRGTAVSFGVVQGRARVISSPSEGIEKGDIIVTSMTRPEFVPLMKKAAAIVTDEGGITCHAAVVSRELGLPCIVGTQNATKVIKNGMRIEVNCNHGVVKIL